ncbi:MAG: hypothetical protein OEV44_14780 [Spirochaetota bacterium]|nr:hypothetical protein [Spirochaetota bacterium]
MFNKKKLNKKSKKQEPPKRTTFTSPTKLLLIIILISIITLFYEAERISFYLSDLKSKEVDNRSHFILDQAITVFKSIENFKSKIGLSSYHEIENEIITYLSESPTILFNQMPLDKEIVKAKPKNEGLNEKLIFSITKELTEASISFIAKNNKIEKENIKKQNLLNPPYKVLLIGDSMMAGEVGLFLERFISKIKGSKVVRKAFISTGLAYPNYFDWTEKLKQYIKRYKPNVLMVMMGTNDFSSLYSRNKKQFISFNNPSWKEEYKNEAISLMKVIYENKLIAFWIGLPIMEEKKFNIERGFNNKKIKLINSIHLESSKLFKDIHYIDLWDLFKFKENNKAKKYIKTDKGRLVPIRSEDGIHLGLLASKKAVGYILEIISKFMIIEK